MIWLLLGGLVLFLLVAGLRAFERASVSSVKSLFAWIAALLTLFGPLIYQRWQAARGRRVGGGTPRRAPSNMTREEAYEVLGLSPGASEAEIREAHRRLMRGAHPDTGGSDWLAARINQARDILLG
jgi:DnaJ-domain-containing protein 1